jgi:CRISPR-associated protein Cas1
MAQYASHQTPLALRIAGALIADKIANARTILRRNHPDGAHDGNWNARMKQLTQMVKRVDSPEELLAREGEAAKLYWAEFEKLVLQNNEAWSMRGRNRRPPQDPVNAMLSFAYAILVKDCTTAVMGPGLDPYLGVFHTPHHGRPSMALDLMEPFRPLIADSVVLGMIRRNEVRPEDFQFTGQAVLMKDHTRKTLLQAYKRRMDELIAHPVFGYRISYRQVLGIQATLLSRVLTGELSGMAAFRVR